MVLALRAQLDRWADDDAVTRIVVTAAGDRAFSAGGDIRALYDLGKAGKHDDALQFWRDEYPLNAAIKNYRKPYVALIDGIAMGGGVGVSVHGSHRVAGDRFSFAMPEVGIGFFPDVGATWFLPRMPGELGTYCALTGERFGDCRRDQKRDCDPSRALGAFCGLARRIDRHGLGGRGACGILRTAGEGPIAQRKSAIDRLFAGDMVENILAAIDREAASGSGDAEWARKISATMRTKSPLSLKLALAQVRRGKDWDFDTCMRMEFRIVSRIIHGHDFYEGVRAVIVDKDNQPRWRPATLADVGEPEIECHFAPLGPAELVLP